MSRRHHRRAGISLIEVMFSMAVAIIGLLGVAALLPLAANQFGRATRADMASTFGLSAIEDLQARGYARPTAWAIWTGTTYEPVVQFNPATNSFVTAAGWEPGDSFCLDPNMLARYPGSALFFPKAPIDTDAPVMHRVTLSDTPSGLDNVNTAFTEEIFVFRDDLIFNRPTSDATLPPIQEFSPDPTGMSPDKRQFEARLSYMVTFSPFVDMADIVRPSGFPFRGAYPQQNLYTMAVVVFDRRNTDPASEMERNPVVSSFPGLGIGGGDIIVEAATEEETEARPGDWMMLGTRLPVGNNPSVFRWYRVLSADKDTVPTSAGFAREIHIEGADWPFADPSYTEHSHATIISGIAAVFEKTVRLEGLSP